MLPNPHCKGLFFCDTLISLGLQVACLLCSQFDYSTRLVLNVYLVYNLFLSAKILKCSKESVGHRTSIIETKFKYLNKIC
jgi:hypothetical protein